MKRTLFTTNEQNVVIPESKVPELRTVLPTLVEEAMLSSGEISWYNEDNTGDVVILTNSFNAIFDFLSDVDEGTMTSLDSEELIVVSKLATTLEDYSKQSVAVITYSAVSK